MPATVTLADSVKNAACNVVVDLADSGSALAYPILRICTLNFAETLCVHNLAGTTAFGNASGGISSAISVCAAPILLSGTAAVCDLQDKDQNILFSGTVGTANTNCLVINSTGFLVGGESSISTLEVKVL